jgi:hypothetical protein
MHYEKVKEKTVIKLPPPNSQKTLLLKCLILQKEIAERDFQYNRFRGDISDLRLKFGLPIRFKDFEFNTVFKFKSRFRRHYILSIDKGKAIKVYKHLHAEAAKQKGKEHF